MIEINYKMGLTHSRKIYDIDSIPVLQVRRRIVCKDLNNDKINLFATLYAGRLIYK